MRTLTFASALFASSLLFAQAPAAPPLASLPIIPRTVDGHLSAAKAAAGTDWTGTLVRLCIPPPPPVTGAGAPQGARGTPVRESWYAEPVKVADNLYFLGTKVHNSWALVGSQGIIVIEALFDYAAKDEILEGLKKVGLDPKNVKYVILSHAHGDHDGGAKLLQDSIPDVRLVYGLEDWDAVDNAANHMGGKPKRSMVGDDGLVISVGNASLRVVTTPGHTAGTLSYLFEVQDQGKPLRVAYVGGTAIPFDGSAAYYERYRTSSDKLAQRAADFGATTLLSNHTEFDNAYFKSHTAAARKPGDANPFDVGAAGVARYFTVVRECSLAAQLRTAGK